MEGSRDDNDTRTTRSKESAGLVLTPTGRGELYAWYAQEDEVENRQINATQRPQRIEMLEAQIKTTLWTSGRHDPADSRPYAPE